jgi:Cu(I)/Ag(I) efflux system membrane fusion protein
MDLVPFEVTEATGAQKVEGLASINISPEKQKMLGVQTQLVSRKNISKTIRTVGRIAHDPELFYAEQEYITSLKTYEQAKNLPQGIALDNAKSMVDASKYKLSLMGFSEGQINDISKKDGPDNSLLLPAGDDKNIWVYASTSKKFNGKIVSIDPVMDPATRSVRARILAINPYGTIEHRTYLDVAIAVELGYKLIVPADAVLDTGIRQVVFIDKGEGTLEPKEVKLGMKNDNYYIVKSGINEGDKVVTNANFLIDSESQLKSVQ